ncbi:MAG: transferrin-binding protein-like solute binding protein [Synechococcus sp. SB0677_bin_5]|nr:transferrin-binding protein-like solute binding protein [Synechococcus sp. SB0677_bin_5]
MKTNAGLLIAFSLALSACGGGGGGGSSDPSLTSGNPTTPSIPGEGDTGLIQNLTNAAPPAETAADQVARQDSIIARGDSLIVSSVYGETQSQLIPILNLRSSCSGTTCTHTQPGITLTTRLSDFEFYTENAQPISTKHGITLLGLTNVNLNSFGAWMEHSAFAVQEQNNMLQGVPYTAWYGLAGGDLTGSRPLGNATWQGLMVGTPATGANRGNRLQGDATLTYSLDNQSLDAAFTNIQDLDHLAAHSQSTVRFSDIPVNSRGEFQRGSFGNQIQGGFYGPGHAEAAGTFEQSNIVGAFGAKKQ